MKSRMKSKKKKKRRPYPLGIPSWERLIESTLKAYSNVSVYHPFLCHTQTAKPHLLHPLLLSIFLLPTSHLLSVLQYLSVSDMPV